MKTHRSSILHRLLSLSLAAVMLLALAACGQSEKPSTQAPGNDAPASTTDDAAQPSSSGEEGYQTFGPGRANPVGFETDKTSSKDTLVIRLNEDNGTLDTVNGGSFNENGIVYSLTGSTLVTEGYTESGDLDFITCKYTLAKDYKWDDDYHGVTFYIREDAKFHDGSDVKVSDVIFSLKRYEVLGMYNYIDWDNIVEVEGNGMYVPLLTERATLMQLFGRFIHIFSEDLYKEAEANNALQQFFYTCKGVSGMYEITEWVPGDHVTMVADENFFGGAPKIKNVIIRFIADQTVAMMELETGGVDLIYDPAWNDVKNVLDGQYGDSITGFTDTQTLETMLGFNLVGPLEDENLRLAIAHAVDWAGAVKGAYEGLAVPAYTLVSSTQAYLRDITDWYNALYDPELAKEYMAKSAYADSGVTLTIINNGDPQKQTLAEMMVNQLNPLGITLNIMSYDTATYNSMQKQTEGWDMWLADLGGTGNPAYSFYQFGAWIGNTNSMIAFPEEATALNDLGTTLLATTDPVKAQAIVDEIQDEYLLNGRWFYCMPVSQKMQYLLFNGNLKNFSYTSSYFYIADAYFE